MVLLDNFSISSAPANANDVFIWDPRLDPRRNNAPAAELPKLPPTELPKLLSRAAPWPKLPWPELSLPVGIILVAPLRRERGSVLSCAAASAARFACLRRLKNRLQRMREMNSVRSCLNRYNVSRGDVVEFSVANKPP